MFGPIGVWEMLVILMIALIIFGPRKLPEMGKSLGKSLAEFKRASNELRNTLEEEVRVENQRERTAQTKARAATPQEPEPPAPTAASTGTEGTEPTTQAASVPPSSAETT